ncbi:hypothetical protein EES46_21135 [Streptomyces sp. ADI98-10]|nr:hypothetical protein EES46_21135 [Streptomyces sp. ADI98-10]
MEYGTGDETVGEVDAAARPLEETVGDRATEQGPVEEGPGQLAAGARAQQEQGVRPGAVRLVLLGRGGEQEQGAGPVREAVEAFGVGGQHRFAAGQRIGQRAAAGELVRGEAAGESGEQAGVSGRLAEEFGAHDRVEPLRTAGQPVQERRGRALVQGREVERGQPGEGGAVGGREEDGGPAARAQPVGRVGEGGPGRRVPGVRVVGADQQGPPGVRFPQSAGQRPGRDDGVRRAGCEGRAEQGAQPATRHGPFGAGGRGVQHGAPVAVRVG